MIGPREARRPGWSGGDAVTCVAVVRPPRQNVHLAFNLKQQQKKAKHHSKKRLEESQKTRSHRHRTMRAGGLEVGDGEGG